MLIVIVQLHLGSFIQDKHHSSAHERIFVSAKWCVAVEGAITWIVLYSPVGETEVLIIDGGGAVMIMMVMMMMLK